MVAINEAYRVLADPGRRAIYDRSLTARSLPDELFTGISSPAGAGSTRCFRAGSGALAVHGNRRRGRIECSAALVVLQP
jgi:curved DNA-binding protein CbpA